MSEQLGKGRITGNVDLMITPAAVAWETVCCTGVFLQRATKTAQYQLQIRIGGRRGGGVVGRRDGG